MRLTRRGFLWGGVAAVAITAGAIPAGAGAEPEAGREAGGSDTSASAAEKASAVRASASAVPAAPAAGAPESSSPPHFGDPGYASSWAEEATLGRINKLAGQAGAVGLYRDGQDTMVVRLPRGADAANLPARVGGFRVRTAPSQFTKASVAATMNRIREITRAHPQAGAVFGFGYNAQHDVVSVEGQLSATAVSALRAVDGVRVIETDDVGPRPRD